MARKTREQKKLADYRRRLKLLEQTSTTFDKPKSSLPSSINYIDTKIQNRELPIDTKNQQDFSRDLKKSLLFIFLIITLEIVIYFAKL